MFFTNRENTISFLKAVLLYTLLLAGLLTRLVYDRFNGYSGDTNFVYQQF